MGVKSSMVGMLPYVAMVMTECLDVGLVTLSKAAMSEGMSHFVFIVYSNALATLLLLPPAFILHRSKRPPLTFSILCNIFLLSLIGNTVMQNCLYTGINYSSSTLASAMSNLTPAFTFLLAVIFGLASFPFVTSSREMEKFELRSSRSQVKIIGTLLSIVGAMVVTFYKGPAIGSVPNHLTRSNSNMLAIASNWILGGLLIATACLSVAIFSIFQAAILKVYPSEMPMVALYNLFGTIQCAAVTLIAERENPNAWILNPDVELISVIYSAVCGSMVIMYVQTWCIHIKGPVFAAIFKPVGVAIAALLSIIFLGETLHLGIIIGSIIIITGFYGVIWAQSREDKGDIHENEKLPSSSQTTPLLHNLNSA